MKEYTKNENVIKKPVKNVLTKQYAKNKNVNKT